MLKAYIRYISSYLPEKTLSNEELVAEFPEWTVEKIADKVGVHTRHIASSDETALDMAVKAAQNLFDEFPDFRKEDIDYILFCTQSPDYFLPTSACLIQNRLGLRTDIGALDFNLGCSGYVYGLSLAKGLILGGLAQNVLLLTAETYSKHLHPLDKGNRTIFGDGATATIVSTHGFAEIGSFSFGTDGSGSDNLIVRTGAMRQPNKTHEVSFDENGNPSSDDFLFMNGSEIFSFTQRNVPKVVKKTLEVNDLSFDDISLFIFHQANTFMLEFLRKKMKIPEEKFVISMENVGNTVSNSIPLALIDTRNKGILRGDVCLCGFGVGYSWAGCVLKIIP